MTTYQLQEGRWGDNWQDYGTYPRDPSDLGAWIAIGENAETYSGKYQHRIIDQSGNVVWQRLSPYEGVTVNLFGDGALQLARIFDDYGIPDDKRLEWTRQYIQWREKGTSS